MTIESHVTSLELSNLLKELGVEKIPCFSWYFSCSVQGNKWLVAPTQQEYFIYEKPTDMVRAFLATELLEMLPRYIDDGRGKVCSSGRLEIILEKNNYNVFYGNAWSSFHGQSFSDENMCNAIAKQLIYLIENKLIEVPK